MNKKGFTLAEILGVIVVISLLLLLIMPTIINKIAENSDKAGNAGDSLIFDASDNYINENASSNKYGTFCIPIQDLIEDGKLVEPVVDVETGEDISDKTVRVTVEENGNITHEIVDEDECDPTSIIYKIDFIINPSGNKWVHERKVIISYPKLGDGYTYQYQIDDGEWKDAKEGNYELEPFRQISTLRARAVGANVITNETDIINIDNEIPKINSLSVISNSRIQIKAIDNVSGIVGYYISEKNETPDVDDDNWVKTDIDANEEATFKVKKNQGTYYVFVKDRAGNISENKNNSITLTNRKVTAKFVKGENVTSIDSTSKSCTILAGNTSCNITLPNIVASKEHVSDGWYNGTTKVGKAKEKYAISEDVTLTGRAIEDVITLSISTTVTTNSITAIGNATALSDIVKYEFSVDGGKTWIDNKDDKIHKFTKLTQGTTYNITLRVTSESGKQATTTKAATTKTIPLPTFTESGVDPKTVTITYPDGCGDTYKCWYQKDNGQEVEVTSKTANVKFTDDGTVIAKVSDGTNSVSSSYNVIMWIYATYHPETWTCPSGYTKSGSGSSTRCSKTQTTNRLYSSSYYSCPSGYPNRSGSTCYTSWIRVTGTVTCVDGHLTHTDYQSRYDECDGSRYQENGDHCASPGSYTYHPIAYCRNSTSAIYHSGYYYCPSGYTSYGSGSSMTCRRTVTTSPNHTSAYYSCPSGYTLSGNRCYPN